MHKIITTGPALTISSVDLVALINSMRSIDQADIRHDTFMEKVAKVIGGGVQKFLGTYIHRQNSQSYPCYHLPKREASLMVMSESYAVQAKVYDHMVELEKLAAAPSPVPAVPTTFIDALRLALEQAETIAEQSAQIEAAKPAVEFVDKYVDATGLKGFRQVCKLAGAKEHKFREFLEDKKIMYRLGAEWVPTARHIDAGRMVVKAGVSDSEHAFNSAKFTPKGVKWVIGEWAQYQLGGVEA